MTNQQPQQPDQQTISVCEQQCGPRPKMHWIHYFWLLLFPIGWIIFPFPLFSAKKKQQVWAQCMQNCQMQINNGTMPKTAAEFKHPKYGEPVNDPNNLYGYTEYHNQKVRAKKGIKDPEPNISSSSGSYWDHDDVKSVKVEVEEE